MALTTSCFEKPIRSSTMVSIQSSRKRPTSAQRDDNSNLTVSQPTLSCNKNSAVQETRQSDFLDVVRKTVESNQHCTYASWYNISGKLSDERTFGQIWETAGRVSHFLHHKLKLKKGQRVVLCYDFGLHFFEVFFGCLRAGVVAVLGKLDRILFYFSHCCVR